MFGRSRVSGPLLAILLLQAWPAAADDTSQQRAAYDTTRLRLGHIRSDLVRRYGTAGDMAQRSQLLAEGRRAVLRTLTETFFPAWRGTRWSYNGVSRVPGRGSIACGAFVVFTLQDAGFRVPWRMLRQPSENIIKNLVPAETIRRYANARPVPDVVADIRRQGDGLYMVGLDYHVGFLVNRGGVVTFWHSTVFEPGRVVGQPADEFSPFTESRYRVVGKLLGDGMMHKWLEDEEFAVTHDYFKHRRPRP